VSVGGTWQLKDLRSYLKKLPKSLEGAAVRGIQAGAQRAIGIVVATGDRAIPASAHGSKGAFDTGEYRRSWKVRDITDGAVLYNASRQAPIIEKGRRPGSKMPPLSVIKAYAIRKLGLSETEAKLARYPIARAIARRGLRARHVLRNALKDIGDVVIAEVKREISAALRGAL
jgi:hypothetical protein